MQAVSARRIRGPSVTSVTKGYVAHRVKLRRCEAAFRADQQCGGTIALAFIVGQAARSTADEQRPGRLAIRRAYRLTGRERLYWRDGKAFGLLRRLDRDRDQAGFVHPMGIGAFGQDRQQRGDAKLGRLLGHESVASRFSRGERRARIRLRGPADAARCSTWRLARSRWINVSTLRVGIRRRAR